MSSLNFCTYFDSHYLPRGLCLLDSLTRHCRDFELTVLCLDDLALEQVRALGHPRVTAVGLAELERDHPELLPVKKERNRLEYYFTCGPTFIRYAFNRNPHSDVITYLDADMFFYDDPQPLFDAFEGHSIGVVGHHLPCFRKEIKEGMFNVGWVSFRRDRDGLHCLDLWRRQCIEWCYDRHEDGKYADQLYLDQWPVLYKGFYEFTHHGANVAAWNAGDYTFSLREGRVYVDDDPLIFYHFHGFKRVVGRVYDPSLWLFFKAPGPVLKREVFAPYIEKMERFSTDRNPTASIRSYRSRFHHLKQLYRCLVGIVFRQYLIYYGNKVF